MELCNGGAGNDLYSMVGKPLPEPLIALIIRDVTKALAYLHDRAIIHRVSVCVCEINLSLSGTRVHRVCYITVYFLLVVFVHLRKITCVST